MTWYMAGAAAVTVGTSYLSGQAANNSAIRQGNAVSRAEGQAIVKERLNMSLRNAYSTSLAQMNLALNKRKLSKQAADINAASLAAKGDAEVAAASTGSIGASTSAVISDINSKTQQALDTTQESFENMVENYNQDLSMMVLNTSASAPTMRPTMEAQSSSSIFGAAVAGGVTSFAGNYAMRKLQLGLGPKPEVPSGVTLGLNNGIRLNPNTRLGGF